MSKRVTLASSFVLMVGTVFFTGACGSSSGGSGGGSTSTVLNLSTFQPASIVMGQPDFNSRMPNQGGAAAQNTLDCPVGIGQGSTWVADTGNNRVLHFPAAGQLPDFVIGQPDFTTVSVMVTASKLEGPTGVHQAEGKLAVCDNDNNRVLIWNTIPTMSGQPANVVVGQMNFTSNGTGTTASTFNSPTGVVIVAGRLIVSDTLNHRVLIWNAVPNSNNASADLVLGQGAFNTNASGNAANEMNRPAGIWSDGTRLMVCDRLNHRVLIWNTFPTTDGQAADLVIGQPGFGSSTGGTSSTLFFAPWGVDSDGTRVVIGDEQNSRVLIYNSFPTTNGQAADVVLGQGDFNHGTDNDDDQDGVTDMVTARTLRCPSGVLIDESNLYVVDEENSRVLLYRSP